MNFKLQELHILIANIFIIVIVQILFQLVINMSDDFFSKKFDDSTKLKLEVFRKYIREWIPVFLTKPKNYKRDIKEIFIFDFFAGPGLNEAGEQGSPLIIIDELLSYYKTRYELADHKIPINLIFNDINKSYIKDLKENIDKKIIPECCSIKCSAESFTDAFNDNIEFLQARDAAKLIIMDQFGIKEITPKILKKLTKFYKADFLFFIASSFVYRFSNTPEFQKVFSISKEEINKIKHSDIHRFICNIYKNWLPKYIDYYLAPFSIKKESNLYGIIFGSGSLKGLEKFLTVAWKLDSKNGEANYNIGDDFCYSGQMSIFEEDNVIRKQDQFKNDLIDFIKNNYCDNIELYRFCLENGFLPKHAKPILKELQNKNEIEVIDMISGEQVRKNSFYIGQNRKKKVRIKCLK